MSGYDPYKVPAVTGGSRFMLGHTPAGWPTRSEAEALAHTAGTLISDRLKDAEKFQPVIEVALKCVVIEDGEVVLADRGTVRGRQTLQNVRPGKRISWPRSKSELFDSFLKGGRAFEAAPDDMVLEAFRQVVEDAGITDVGVLRRLNDVVAIGLAGRAGLELRYDSLPHPPALVRRTKVVMT